MQLNKSNRLVSAARLEYSVKPSAPQCCYASRDKGLSCNLAEVSSCRLEETPVSDRQQQHQLTAASGVSRRALVAGAVSATLLTPASASAILPTCSSPSATSLGEPSTQYNRRCSKDSGPFDLTERLDGDGRFTFQVPCSWEEVKGLDPAYGVAASFFNPKEPGIETAALYVANTSKDSVEDLGSPQEFGSALANIAPWGELQETFPFEADGRQYYFARVQFGGNTAGGFGAAIEMRAVTISQGLRYTLRVTASRARWLDSQELRMMLRSMAVSLRVNACVPAVTSKLATTALEGV